MTMRFKRVVKEFDFQGTLVPVGTYVQKLDYMTYKVVSAGDLNGLEIESIFLHFEDLGELDPQTGEIYFFASAAGWNTSFSWYPIGVPGCPHPRKGEKFYRLKPSETLSDYPQFAPREEQLSWLEDRKANWYAPQEAAPVKYADHTKVCASQTLDEFCSSLGIDPSELTYKVSETDPGKEYREKGFRADMPLEEARELGKRYYYGFRWETVKRELEKAPTQTQTWVSPTVWAKIPEETWVRKQLCTHIVKKEKVYTFSITKNLWTNAHSVLVR